MDRKAFWLGFMVGSATTIVLAFAAAILLVLIVGTVEIAKEELNNERACTAIYAVA